MIRRSVQCLLVFVLFLAPSMAEGAGLLEWICKKLKKDCSGMLEVASVRGPERAGPVVGTRLVRYDQASETEVVLWECETCWSPAALSLSQLAVLRPDGLWVIPLSSGAAAGMPARVVEAAGLLRILGPSKENERLVLILREFGSDRCPEVVAVNLESKTIQAVDGQPREVACDVFGPRADQWRGDLLVGSTSSRPDRPWSLRVGPARGEGPWRLFLPDTAKWDDGASRLDPIWFGDQVVYVVSP